MTDFNTALTRLWPHGDEKIPGLRAGMIATAPAAFAKYGITSPLLISQVVAQISHECGAGHEVTENLSYSAERMTRVWPARFPTLGSAAHAHNPRRSPTRSITAAWAIARAAATAGISAAAARRRPRAARATNGSPGRPGSTWSAFPTW
jgi:predicted chitinase